MSNFGQSSIKMPYKITKNPFRRLNWFSPVPLRNSMTVTTLVCMNVGISWFTVKMEIFMAGHQKRCRSARWFSLLLTGSPNVNFEKCWAIWFCYNETKAFFSRLSFLQRLFVRLTPRRGPFTLHSFGVRPPTKRLQQKTTSLWEHFYLL